MENKNSEKAALDAFAERQFWFRWTLPKGSKMTTERKPETLKEARKADRISTRISRLRQIPAERQALFEESVKLVEGLRRDGVTWAKIADALGMPRSNAYDKYDPKGRTARTLKGGKK